MLRSTGVLPFLMLLAACGDQSPQQSNAAVPAVPKVNAFQQKMLALNEIDRSLVLRRAVQDDGGRCPKIKGSAYQQEYKGMSMWVASCSEADWAVFLGPEDNVQARLCSQERELGLPECKPVENSGA